ncbi:MAG: AmmeMemoRadiSam system protein B, partial [Candidatus Aminicenantes bacterium]|nr:AmmeMemoRadiSam system protein B [Candidatus Aminicenantes bacterium]
MKNKFLGGLLFCFLTVTALAGQGVRRPAVAGVFYDADPARLAAFIEAGLDAAPEKAVSGDIAALIVPHAGYACSGAIAARGYRQLKGRAYDAVVVIGPSHHVAFEGCSIYPRGGYETPLGVAAIDERLAAELAKRTRFGFVAAAHEGEHSLEVQVPFLQTVLPGTPIVPVVMGRNARRNIQTLADGLVEAGAGKKILVVASTDLSHYLSKRRANAVDGRTIEIIKGY